MSADTPVLDPTCGTRAMWFDKFDPRAIMCDQRAEAITVTDRSHGRQDGTRTLTIDPDIQCDFRELPFPDTTFRLVVFDPPHLVRAGRRSWGEHAPQGWAVGSEGPMVRMGKKAAGRELDGRTWDEYPKEAL